MSSREEYPNSTVATVLGLLDLYPSKTHDQRRDGSMTVTNLMAAEG